MKRLFIAFGITLIIGLLIFLVSTFFKPKDTKLEEETPEIKKKTYEFDISYAEEIALDEASSKIEENEKDRRSAVVSLTPLAAALKKDYDEVTKEMENIYYKGFSQEEIAQFENYLKRVLSNLEEINE